MMEKNLPPRDLWWRGVAMLMLCCGAFGLRVAEPGSFAWLPLPVSCGAASGLPCLFCGMTRALHHLLHGEFALALYFNWLAFPFALAMLTLSLKLGAELTLARRVLVPFRAIRLTPRSVGLGVGAVIALWIVQVSLAVALHKHELLNPDGPLYALFLK